MPLPVPVLDDLEWSELVEEARDRVPAIAPAWTDQNLHDPGITIIELLAFTAEQLCYRLDQIPDSHRTRFLTLLGVSRGDDESIDDVLARASRILWAHERLADLVERAGVDSLDQLPRSVVDDTEVPARAATTWDIERLALATPGFTPARVRAWPNHDLDLPCALAPGTVSVTVVPDLPRDQPMLSDAERTAVSAHLDRHRTVGTRIKVFAPRYTTVTVAAVVAPVPDARTERVTAAVTEAVTRFLHPLDGGPDGTGWPFGRDVYQSELLAVIGAVDGVDLPVSVTVASEDDASNQRCANACVPAAHLVSLVSVRVDVVPTDAGHESCAAITTVSPGRCP